MNRMLNLLLVFAFGAAFSAGAEEPTWVRENELAVDTDFGRGETQEAVCDLRTAFTVATLENDPALKGLMYSAIGWELDAAVDPLRTAEIYAVPGSLVDGAFVPSGERVAVLPATTSRGSFNWQVTSAEKKLYQLTHTVRNAGAVDATGTLVGYIDFSHAAIWAPQDDVEAAVLGERTQSLTVTQDATWPWQPIGTPVALSGIRTDETLGEGVATATTFSFTGVGAFNYEYALDGGQLTIVVDGVETVLAATAGAWTSGTVEFGTSGDHVVAFSYVAAGGGSTAALRNVSRSDEDGDLASAEGDDICVDLQEGEVRTPKKLAWVLPFVYSPTNFIGTVDGTAARVSIVRLEGDDPDVTQWTEVGTPRVLKRDATDEGEVVWRAKKGVWKAVFEFYNGDKLLEKQTQVKIFDLRNATGNGLVIFVN